MSTRQNTIEKNMKTVQVLLVMAFCATTFFCPAVCSAAAKKGLLVYDSHYGSTIEVAYWIRSIIGNDQYLDVKKIDQVITVIPYDYVIIGSNTKNEKPAPQIYKFVEAHRAELAKKEVCYFLVCGDWDETMVLKVPGGSAHIIAGRNYLYDIQDKYPDIKPVVIGSFGGRQVTPSLEGLDSLQIWALEKVAKEGCGWVGLDIWETLVPERVEAFGNEVRVKVLGLQTLAGVEQYRFFWQSLQPGSLTDPTKKKYTVRPYTVVNSNEKMYYSRSRITGDLETVITLLNQWAQKEGFTLKQQKRSFFNVYYHAVKTIDGKEMTAHIVPATIPEDPGTVHISLRAYGKPDARKPLEDALKNAEQILWSDGRKVDGR